MATDIVDNIKEYTDDIRTKVYGSQVRSAISDGMDALARDMQDAVDNQITGLDEFFTVKRLAQTDTGKYGIVWGGISPNGTRVPSDDNVTRSITSYITLEAPFIIKLENNTDYCINRIRGYLRNGSTYTPEQSWIVGSALSPTESVFIAPNETRSHICVSIRRVDDTAISQTELQTISAMFAVYKQTDSTFVTEGAPADAKAVGAAIYAGRDPAKNTPRVMTWFSDWANLTSLSDMPPWSMFSAQGDFFQPLLGDGFPGELSAGITYCLEKQAITNAQNAYIYYLSDMAHVNVWSGYVTVGGTSIVWNRLRRNPDKTLSISGAPADAKAVGDAIEAGGKVVRILVFGNSFSYSDLGMMPALLAEYGVLVELGILYYSGASIQDHIDHFNDQTPYSVFSFCDGTKWTNAIGSFTAQDALSAKRWDYIVFQAGNPENLETLADLVANYVDYPFAFLFNNNHSVGANCPVSGSPIGEEGSDNSFLTFASRAQNLLENGNVILDVLPCGAAVQNARQLSVFKSIGVLGYLCHDDVGHLQNGIATLIPAYAASLKILDIIGAKQKIFCSRVRPTDEWLSLYNIYTKTLHGNSEGLTDANILLAAKCAMQAYKHPFEITTIE